MKSTIIFILILTICSCKTQENLPLKKCIDKESMDVLNRGLEVFESKLRERYGEIEIEKAYFEYIEDLSGKKINPDFFLDKESNLIGEQIRKLDIWIESSRTSENMELESKIYNVESLNPISVKMEKEFQVCLARKIECKGIRAYLMSNYKYRLSPAMAKKIIYRGTSENDMKNSLNRTIIVLGLYYQVYFNIKT